MSKRDFVEVAIGLPIRKIFTYAVPERMKEKISPGARVLVPFRSQKMIGYTVGFCKEPKLKNIKSIIDLIDEEPIFEKDLLALSKWICEYYFCSFGQALEAAIPSYLKKGKSLDYKQRKLKDQSVYEIADPLFETAPELSLQQKQALNPILEAIKDSRHDVFLLHGITGSGKTEIYFKAIEEALKKGRTVIYLFPEISLTPQTISRFNARFKGMAAILHSRLTPAERFFQWKKIKFGEAKIVVGARSAIFAPAKKLGLIVLDEEHETTYKQEEAPRYHARDAAIQRAKICNAVVILGSATPSLESFYNAKNKRFKSLSLTERIEDKKLPDVKIADMREQNNQGILSGALQRAIFEVLNSKQQAILFLNRRGFSTFINCRNCGFVLRCKFCSVALRYHHPSRKLFCHWCNFQADPPKVCPKCKSSYIRYFGIGTQKVESELARLFPQAKIARMDTDVTKLKGAHFKILGEFKQGKIDLLIGTQMIAKGLDFPKVTLVGVISADTALNLPDFRSGERTFNLLTQVSGRAGRGDKKGTVIIQTYAPEHYAVKIAGEQDFLDFYEKELSQRKELSLPPYSHLASIILSSRSNKKAQDNAVRLAELIKGQIDKKKVDVIGPAPPPIEKLRKNFRWRILLKAKDTQDILEVLDKTVEGFNRERDIKITVDIDPI